MFPEVIALQRHFRVLTKFAHVALRLSGNKRQRGAVFYAPVNLCDRRPCSASVAVGLVFVEENILPQQAMHLVQYAMSYRRRSRDGSSSLKTARFLTPCVRAVQLRGGTPPPAMPRSWAQSVAPTLCWPWAPGGPQTGGRVAGRRWGGSRGGGLPVTAPGSPHGR